MNNSSDSHSEIIIQIIKTHFDETPLRIIRKKVGVANEVYEVVLHDQSVIVRLGIESEQIRGSSKYIPLFKSKGIVVPDIIAENFTKFEVPYPYQILTKIPGDDIGTVIHTLSKKQLLVLASEISHIFDVLGVEPTNGKFGFVYCNDSELYDTWTEHERASMEQDIHRAKTSGVADEQLIGRITALYDAYAQYFDSVQSRYYYDDLSSKNIMIDNGVFSGLVDLDGVAYGDHLETIGRIKASWYGTDYGAYYTNAVMDAQGLNEEKRHMVSVYAVLHRFSWLCEAGVRRNANTTAEIDRDTTRENVKIVDQLLYEVQLQ